MMKLEAAARQALEALEHSHADEPIWKTPHRDAAAALREALAEQATDPDWKSEATALRVNEQNLEAKLALAPAPALDTLAEARAYADQRWDGEDVPIEWLRHFVDGLGRQAAQQAAEQPPYGWVRMNGVFNSGVFHLGATCPPGWVGAAEAVTLLVAPIQQAAEPAKQCATPEQCKNTFCAPPCPGCKTAPTQQALVQFNAAIDFAIEQGAEGAEFLRCWREGDTSDWPEFTGSKT